MTYLLSRSGITLAVGLLLISPAFAQNPPATNPPANNPPAKKPMAETGLGPASPYPLGGLNPAAQGALLNRVTPAPVVGAGPATNTLPLNAGGRFSSTPTPVSSTPPYNPNTAFNYSTVYPGWDPWGGTYFPSPFFPRTDPFSGFMRGAADILSASGSFAVRVQESRMIGEQVRQARIDTRRKIFDQWLYERANTPTNQDMREEIQRLELRRALTDPPPAEIMTAIPLNQIFRDLAARPVSAPKGPALPIDEGTLRQINVRPPNTPGNVGVLRSLRDGVQMNWPPLLKSEPYQNEVKLINQRAAAAVNQVISRGEVDPSSLKEMDTAIADLKKRLDDSVTELTAAEWIEAKRFLGQVQEATKALRHPAVANFFTDKYVAKGRTVPELVDYMKTKGLEFAPASTGDEASYMALYNYLQNYTNSIGSAPLQPRDE